MSRSTGLWLLVPLAFVALAAAAQDTSKAKKLYCWNDPKSGRTCSDALPADRVNIARDEFSLVSGAHTGVVEAAMTPAQRADAAAAAAQVRADQAAADTRRRTEQAMLVSYSSEAELRRVFAERTTLVDNSVQTARYNVTSMRQALIAKLQLASSTELAGKPVNAKLADDIGQRHNALVHQQDMLSNFERQRAQLRDEVEDSLQRYRALKGSAPAAN